jgi:hypothetical protein
MKHWRAHFFTSLQWINHVFHLPPLLETRICTVFSFFLCE